MEKHNAVFIKLGVAEFILVALLEELRGLISNPPARLRRLERRNIDIFFRIDLKLRVRFDFMALQVRCNNLELLVLTSATLN
jgi:hypothetical protein